MKFLFSDFIQGVLYDVQNTGRAHTARGLPRTRVELSSCYGYILNGSAQFIKNDAQMNLTSGMYFSLSEKWLVDVRGDVFVIESEIAKPMTTFGGPVESVGRLRYIDGCTDSLLIPPTRLGDPCLNLLVFPAGVEQTPHIHPSFRIGVVIKGEGYCVTSEKKLKLSPGLTFLIDKNFQHCFHAGPQGLAVITYHPDSNFGPTDEVHPMINGTLI